MDRQAQNAIRHCMVKNENTEEESALPTDVCGGSLAEPAYPTEPQDLHPAEVPKGKENERVDLMEGEIVPSESGAEGPVPNAFPWSEHDDFQDDDDEETLADSRSKSMLPDDVQKDDEMMDGQTPASGEVPTDPADQQVPPSNPPAPTPPVPPQGVAPTGIPQPEDPGQAAHQGGQVMVWVLR